jgi:hypothetical protein
MEIVWAVLRGVFSPVNSVLHLFLVFNFMRFGILPFHPHLIKYFSLSIFITQGVLRDIENLTKPWLLA